MDPKLARYAEGDFLNAGKCLFGQGFMKEVVSQVEADTAIYKALALASKLSERKKEFHKVPSTVPNRKSVQLPYGFYTAIWIG